MSTDPSDTILANAMLVLPDEVIRGSVRLSGDRIVGIDAGTSVPPGAMDCGGDYVAPGLIELHTDNLERHMKPRPKVDWPHAAAIIAHDAELASVGITTVYDAIRVGSIITGKTDYAKYARQMATEILEMRGKGALRISHFLHLRAETCSETLIDELAEFGPEDRVGIVSIMDHTPGQRQFADVSKYKDYVCGKHGLDEAEFDAHVAHLEGLHDRLGAAHEAATVAAAARFGAVLASHDDTTAAHVEVSAGHGIKLAEFPTTEVAARACREAGIAVMMGAPNIMRGGSHSGNVAAADLEALGLLDIISSDYVPSALLTAAVRLGEAAGRMDHGIAKVTDAPARAVGLTDRGRLEQGLRADLIRFAVIDGYPVVRAGWSAGRRAS